MIFNTGQSKQTFGFTTTLTILFVVLKVAGLISWSWWWVFSPLLIGAALWLLAAACFMVMFLITILLSK